MAEIDEFRQRLAALEQAFQAHLQLGRLDYPAAYDHAEATQVVIGWLDERWKPDAGD